MSVVADAVVIVSGLYFYLMSSLALLMMLLLLMLLFCFLIYENFDVINDFAVAVLFL